MTRRLNTFLTPLSLLILIAAAGCGFRDSAALVEKGLARLEAGDPAAAARALARASRRINDSAPLYYNLGTAYYHLGKTDAAVSSLQAALRIDPAHQNAHELLAMAHIRMHQHALAATNLAALLPSVAPDTRPRVLNTLAMAERGAGRTDLACLRLLQAERLAPRYAPSYYNLGKIYQADYQLYAEATDQLEIYTRLAPEGDPHVDQAREALRRLKASSGAAAAGTQGRGNLSRNSDAAIRAIRDGDAHYRAKRWTLAEAAYTRALNADPLSYEAAIRLGHARSANGHFAEAVKAFQRAGEIAPGQRAPIDFQVRTAYSARNYEQAANLLTMLAIPKWPAHPDNYQIMAYIRFAQQRPAEARIYGEHYLAIASPRAPEFAPFRDWLSRLPQPTR